MSRLKTCALLTSIVMSINVAVTTARPMQETGPLPTSRWNEVNGRRLVQFSGTLKDSKGQPLAGALAVTFAIYKDGEGGAPLWQETQNVTLDAQGRYSVLLGATSAEGMPVETFSADEPRWLGIRPQTSDNQEQGRMLLVSVPYALKAADADTLGGKPLSAFVLADSSSKDSPGNTPDAASRITVADQISNVIMPGTVGHLAKYITSNDVDDAVSTEDSSGNVTTTGSFTGAAHWLNRFGSAPSANGVAMSAANTVVLSTNAQPRMTINSRGNAGVGLTDKLSKLAVAGNPSFSLTGTVSVSAGSTAVTGTGTSFLSELGIGDRVRFEATGEIRAVFSIASNTSFSLQFPASATATASTMTVFPSLFRVQTLAGSTSFLVTDQGTVNIGAVSTGSQKVWVSDTDKFSGTSSTNTAINGANVSITTSTSQAADVGAVLALGGSRGTKGTGIFAGPRGGKENSTNDNDAGYLGLYTANSSSTFAERVRVTSNGNVAIGTKNASRELEVNGGVRLNTGKAKPTCNASNRGTFWVTKQGPGVEDSVEVCIKNAADLYVWKTLF